MIKLVVGLGNIGKEYELEFVTKDETAIIDVTKEKVGE